MLCVGGEGGALRKCAVHIFSERASLREDECVMEPACRQGGMEDGRGKMGKSTVGVDRSTVGIDKSTVEDGKSTLEDGKSTLEDGESTLEDGKSTLEDCKSTLWIDKSSH